MCNFHSGCSILSLVGHRPHAKQYLMKTNKLYIFLVLVNTLIHAEIIAQPDSLDQKINAIFKTYNRTDGPGCAVSVIRNDTVVFSKGFGMANLEYDIPISPSTVFDIASVSKQFTGFAISKMIQDGEIFGQDDIRKYLPDVPSFGKTITINHLLHHSSGLRDWPEALAMAGWRWDEVFSFDDIMRMVKTQKALDFEPGTKYSYSNTGYNLLAAIVEKVSGMTFRSWTDKNIFKPLGMTSSKFQDDYTEIIKNLAHSYEPTANGFGNVPGALTAYGSSSLFTTVEDLSKWVINFDRQIKQKSPVYINMLNLGKLDNGKSIPYGYGLETGTDRGIRTVSHTGGWASYRTIISSYPDQSLSIIILSNSGDFNPSQYSSKIADLFLSKKWQTTPTVFNKVRDYPTVVLDSAIARKYTGTYLLRPGKLITISYEDGRLMTQATGEPKFPTEAKSDSTIWIEAYGAPMTFVKGKSGKINMLKYRDIDVIRVKAWVADPKLLYQYTGTYYSEELAAEYKIIIKEGKLEVSHRRGGEFLISPDPSVPDLFTSDSGYVQFVRNNSKKIIGFKFSGSRIKNIFFDKQ